VLMRTSRSSEVDDAKNQRAAADTVIVTIGQGIRLGEGWVWDRPQRGAIVAAKGHARPPT